MFSLVQFGALAWLDAWSELNNWTETYKMEAR